MMTLRGMADGGVVGWPLDLDKEDEKTRKTHKDGKTEENMIFKAEIKRHS